MTTSSTHNLLHVTVIDVDTQVYDGEAKALTSENYKGKFDILSLHTNFISIIKGKLTIHQLDNSTKEFAFNRAILRCFSNEVNVYLGL